MSLRFPEKNPVAILAYQVNWSAWLAAGETITAAVVTVPAGITLNPDGKTTTFADGKSVTFWLAGGTAGMAYSIDCKITTSTGQTDERTIKLPVLDR